MSTIGGWLRNQFAQPAQDFDPFLDQTGLRGPAQALEPMLLAAGPPIIYGGTAKNQAEMTQLDNDKTTKPSPLPDQPVSPNRTFSRAAQTPAQQEQLRQLLKARGVKSPPV